MKPMVRGVALVLFVLFVIAPVTAAADETIPPRLRQLILENYPPDILCEQEADRQQGEVVPPLDEHFDRGWIHVRIADLSPKGPTIAMVLYNYCLRCELHGGTLVIFLQDGEGWTRFDPVGVPGGYVTANANDVSEPEISLVDVDGDGTKEIVDLPDIWKVTPVGLKALTPVEAFPLEVGMGPYYPQGEPEECHREVMFVQGEMGWGSDTGMWFRDLDGDGVMELILGPDKMEDPDPDPAEYPPMIDATGYRIYALRNGVYSKVA